MIAHTLCVAAVAAASLLTLQAERVPDAAVVNGVPQGIFVGRSLLTGRAVCLLFLSGGRITRAIPDGGLESFEWARHRAAHSGDSGTWQMRGGQLVVTWGDGGVHQGPITERPDGIEFYGKRYAKPARVTLAAIAGRWESARGTAIAGGPGINRVSTLVIQADGRYQWDSTTGGVVSGRAVAADRSLSGQVIVKSQTILFTSDNGRTTSHTFLPVAGTPTEAFSVDADMFTRSGPAPIAAPAPQAAASAGRGSASATSHQGLQFTTPPGWTSAPQQGHLVLMPANATRETGVLVVLSGSERLNGKTFDDWLSAKMTGDLASGLKLLQGAPPTRGRSGAIETLSAGRTVQDASGGVVLQIYHAVSDGQQAGLAMVMTASEAALKTHMPAVQAILQSLRF